MMLLATAPTLEAIRESVLKFYCGTPMVLAPIGVDTWQIIRQRDGKVLEGMTIVKRRGRFRFEGAA